MKDGQDLWPIAYVNCRLGVWGAARNAMQPVQVLNRDSGASPFINNIFLPSSFPSTTLPSRAGIRVISGHLLLPFLVFNPVDSGLLRKPAIHHGMHHSISGTSLA